jgi:diaminobutyrate-2-oxoglutarate transaminase
MRTIEALESQVRTYSRSFPTVFKKAQGSYLYNESDKKYLDFFSGAGSLNYGHNNPRLKRSLIEYVENDGITHSLDMATVAKRRFLERFNSVILKPRKLEYKIQFPGPTGTNAVEASLKLARKVTGRSTVVHFVNSFHGMTMGSLAVTGNISKRNGAGVPLPYSLPMFFDGDLGAKIDTLDYFETLLSNSGNGIGIPAAVIVETIQAEGGVKVASQRWLQRLEQITKNYRIVLIVDDIQVGCGRTGDFFSFEAAGIMPDLICLSKSIGGYGLPMSLLLIRPDFDVWKPGEHSGTFRGNNFAFVTAAEALSYWEDSTFSNSVKERSQQAINLLEKMARNHPEAKASVRGRGLIQGVVCGMDGLAAKISQAAFERGLIIETAGPKDEALKVLPCLTVTQSELEEGVAILEESLEAALQSEVYRDAALASD